MPGTFFLVANLIALSLSLTLKIEANPNPFIAKDEDFARSAAEAGIEYDPLIQWILHFGLGDSLHNICEDNGAGVGKNLLLSVGIF
jgi:hypothetical protein